MSSFIYFTEEAKSPIGPDKLAEFGLRYAFDSKPQSGEISGRTPSGGSGWLFASVKRLGSARLGFDADRQEWRQIPGAPVWVGYWKEQPPTAKGLARPHLLPGSDLRLADGDMWRIPRIRLFAGELGYQVALPVVADLDEEGNWISGGVQPHLRSIDLLADRLHHGIFGSDLDEEGEAQPALEAGEMLSIACDLLRANYYLSRVEVAMLGLLSTDATLVEVGRIAMDVAALEEYLKKNNGASELVAGDGSRP